MVWLKNLTEWTNIITYLLILTLGKLSNFQSVQKVDKNFKYCRKIKVNKEKKYEKSLKIGVLCENEKKNSC